MSRRQILVCTLAVLVPLFAVNFATGDRQTLFGDPHNGLTTEENAEFDAGLDEFSDIEGVADGLGPVFNDRSCANCHSVPVIGGGSTIIETRFGTTTDGAFDHLSAFGGSLIQTTGIGPADGSAYTYLGEVVPASATIVAGRRTQPLFGLGLVDAVPDEKFFKLARKQAEKNPSIAGRPNVVTNLVTGLPAVGKFGWKGQVPNLLVFSADAYLNEMGITSPMFPDESCPQGDCSLLAFNPVPELNDDGEDVELFNDFMTLLGPPPRGPINRDVREGETVFENIGCALCHMPTLESGPNEVAALSNKQFHPYSDFLLHDMGSLGDGIHQGLATGGEMRTAPLWGLRVITTFLHDGRANTVEGAILAHAGQGLASRNAFATLSPRQKADLLAFLNSL